MGRPDVVEVYIGKRAILRAESSFAPDDGDLITIRKQTYRVVGRSFTVDHADDYAQCQFRCNVIVEPEDTP